MTDSREKDHHFQRYLYLGDALISLIFISKLTLAFTHLIPYHIPPFVYQGGMHPYINIISTVVLAFFFFLYATKKVVDFKGKIYIASIF